MATISGFCKDHKKVLKSLVFMLSIETSSLMSNMHHFFATDRPNPSSTVDEETTGTNPSN